MGGKFSSLGKQKVRSSSFLIGGSCTCFTYDLQPIASLLLSTRCRSVEVILLKSVKSNIVTIITELVTCWPSPCEHAQNLRGHLQSRLFLWHSAVTYVNFIKLSDHA